MYAVRAGTEQMRARGPFACLRSLRLAATRFREKLIKSRGLVS